MLDPNSPQAQSIANLFNGSMLLGTAIFMLVTGLVLYVLWRYRSRGDTAEPRQYPGNRRLEIAWTIAPALIVAGLFGWQLDVMRDTAPPADRPPDIIVTGYSWWWRVEYPKAGFVTANEIHIPVGRQVLFQLQAADVIHNFWVPDLGPKRDMIPGHPNNTVWLAADRPGVYLGACSEYCGLQHAWMRLRVVAQPQAEYDAWIQQQQTAATPADAEAARGAEVFQNLTCVNCHAITGISNAQAGPDLSHVGGRATLGAGIIENTPANLSRWIANPHDIKSGVQMPGYQLSEADLRALVAYLGSLK
ncbi:MAG: cytochrome c oxidase subunit II [Chloroflexi bacterium]|nr:cytochrome c oxidase subunit II [Chloroflexota bacterium]